MLRVLFDIFLNVSLAMLLLFLLLFVAAAATFVVVVSVFVS